LKNTGSISELNHVAHSCLEQIKTIITDTSSRFQILDFTVVRKTVSQEFMTLPTEIRSIVAYYLNQIWSALSISYLELSKI
jgi:hypothetical protein